MTLALGGTDDGDASAGQVGGAKSSVPAERNGLAGDGVDHVDNNREGRVGELRLHEDLLGREGGLAERAEDEGVDAVGAVDKVGSAVLLAVLRLVVGDEADIDVDDFLGFSLSHAGLFSLAGED